MLQVGVAQDVIGDIYILGRFDTDVIAYLKLGSPRPWQDDSRMVLMVWVDEEYRRQGVATTLWHFAKENGYKPTHELQKSDEGVAWAKAVGD